MERVHFPLLAWGIVCFYLFQTAPVYSSDAFTDEQEPRRPLVPLLNVASNLEGSNRYFVVFHNHVSSEEKMHVRHIARHSRSRTFDAKYGNSKTPQQGQEEGERWDEDKLKDDEQVYTHALNGFCTSLDEKGLHELMQRPDLLNFIELDRPVKAFGVGNYTTTFNTSITPPPNVTNTTTSPPSTTAAAINSSTPTGTPTPSASSTTTATIRDDSLVHAFDSIVTKTNSSRPGSGNSNSTIQRTGRTYSQTLMGTTDYPFAGWNLDRIDQRPWNMDPGAIYGYGDSTYTYRATGQGVDVYVLDTGINYLNSDFAGRAVPVYDGKNDADFGVDCDGHGTHVAGIIGGRKWGVAKLVNLKGVKVLNCYGQGMASDVVAGIDFVISRRATTTNPSVINLSLGGDFSQAINDAVARATAAGIVVVCAAGNDYGTDACTISPASAPASFTVGATDSLDMMADYSNVGTCVDIFAPGTTVVSDFVGYGSIDPTTSIEQMDGTSMASPHVAGVVAMYLEANRDASPGAVQSAVVGFATRGVINAIDAMSPNALLYSQVIDNTFITGLSVTTRTPRPIPSATGTAKRTMTRPNTPTVTRVQTRSPSRTRTRTRTRSRTRSRTRTRTAGKWTNTVKRTPTRSRSR